MKEPSSQANDKPATVQPIVKFYRNFPHPVYDRQAMADNELIREELARSRRRG